MSPIEIIRAYIRERKKHGPDCICVECEDHASALAALERIEQDTARLDWLEHRWVPGGDSISQALLEPWGTDLRAAIDAARHSKGTAK